MSDIFKPNQRILILQGLAGQPDYSLSSQMIQKLLESFGHGVSMQAVNSLIDWLKESELVTSENLNGSIQIVKISNEGLDVAQGRRIFPGVDRPLPQE